MTQEQQEKLRRVLYNAKFTTDAEDENPFVGVYFDDLLAIIEEYVEPPIYHEGWLAGEANLAKEYKNIQWVNWIPVEERLPEENEEVLAYNAENEEVIACDYHHKKFHCWPEVFGKSITHWMPMPQAPRKEE